MQKQEKNIAAQWSKERLQVSENPDDLAIVADHLRQIHPLTINNHSSLEELLKDYLQAGCEMLQLSTGIVSQVKNQIYQILAVESPLDLKVGYQVSDEDTYASEVIKTQQTVHYLEVGAIESMQCHPVYTSWGLESFIGTPIFVKGIFYGTLSFADTLVRQSEFTRHEIEIVELMAKSIGQFLAMMATEAALTKSELLFRNTFEQVAVGIAHVSSAGNFIQVNQKLCDILGYETEHLLQLTFQEITYPQDLFKDLEQLQKLLRAEISSYSLEKRYICHDHSIKWANLTVSLSKNSQGQPSYFINVIEDISDRKNAELALEQSRLKLEQAGQEKSSFIAQMNHELRTPLNSILGFNQILRQDPNLTPEQLTNVLIIEKSGEHLLNLIDDILDFSKLEAGDIQVQQQELNLIDWLDNIATIFRFHAQQKNLAFNFNILPEVPINIKTDSTRLQQVLTNLLSNAVKFTVEGEINFIISCLQQNYASKTAIVRFTIEDTGRGIPQDKIANVFSPFVQLKETGNQEGTGLGLTITQDILRLMDSNIELTSISGKGSKFWFDLVFPLVNNDSFIGSLNPASLTISVLQESRKILIVDDNYDNCFLLKQYLQPLGFIVEVAENGIEGLTKANIFQPDLILLDWAMPECDGSTMTLKLRQDQKLNQIPIIVISASKEVVVKLALANYFVACLSKPIDLPQLLQIITANLKIDWIAPNPISRQIQSVMTIPPQNELANLYNLAHLGDLKSIKEQAALLQPQYTDFKEFIFNLADSFQIDKLIEFIEIKLNN